MTLLKDASIIQRFSDGEVIISEGIASNNAYIVLSGKVRVTKKLARKTLVISTLKEGDIFGEMGLITNAPRSASVSALGDVEVGFIDKEKFDELLDTLPTDVRVIINALVHRLRSTSDMLIRIGSELENTRKQMKSTQPNL
jgi:CRP/FNR family cyclic AMP-dependent transcriptional regulator